MKKNNSQITDFSPAIITGLGACLLAVILAIADGWLVVVPLAGFIFLCLAAPFFPRFSFYLPVTSRGNSGENAVAITFDDGPDPLTTPLLLNLLEKYQIKATFFITGKKAAGHPELVEQLVSRGHLVGNHSYNHSYRVLFRAGRSIVEDIQAAQGVFNNLGIIPLAYRPPAGLTSPGLKSALMKTGLYAVNFSCRSLDGGNRRISNMAGKILNRIQPDDIILLHDLRPPDERLIPDWLTEIELLLKGINKKGFTVLPLSKLINRPVMMSADDSLSGGNSPAPV